MSKILTREEWLQEAIVQATPLFEQHGYTVPAIRPTDDIPLEAEKKEIDED